MSFYIIFPVSPSGSYILGRNVFAIFSSFFSRNFSITRDGIVTNMFASLHSIYFSNWLYFSIVASMIYEKWIIWLHISSFRKYLLPFSHDFSYSTSAVTNSGLFFNYGSTTSMFSSYFLINYLNFEKEFLICSASCLTAFD